MVSVLEFLANTDVDEGISVNIEKGKIKYVVLQIVL